MTAGRSFSFDLEVGMEKEVQIEKDEFMWKMLGKKVHIRIVFNLLRCMEQEVKLLTYCTLNCIFDSN